MGAGDVFTWNVGHPQRAESVWAMEIDRRLSDEPYLAVRTVFKLTDWMATST